ncbi:MAG: hypothetical protein A2664_03775 [Candidatus Taylorbacteria bacterium RIFCSPHIGHO2_01_FULL_46_22b]|uniref:Uncharacterized protein n=1 Tax=Candidatus Taylorbacteria bacterium RIFCSPHIGHO2_01_FULL_46_22b TaxID=1802301 RepID=A0A1G2M1E4_9BACT|nr:MAG: hypothetical protein A2664_03775 [Candidatus Taylorbacteria bacterium RIFCSPHIGHO2_01_FULL_46_22b]
MKTSLNLVVAALLAVFINIPSPASAGGGKYQLVLTPANPWVGQSCSLFIDTPTGISTWGDWIALYPIGKPLQSQTVYNLLGHRDWTIGTTFHTAGDWVLQYMGGDGVGLSEPIIFTVRWPDRSIYQVSVSTNRVVVGTQVRFAWKLLQTNFSRTGDTVGYYSHADPNRVLTDVITRANTEGSYYFPMSRPGTYHFGYFIGGTADRIAGEPIVVTVLPIPVQPALAKTGSTTTIGWFGLSGATYTLLSTTNLNTPLGGWENIAVRDGAGGNQTVSLPSHDQQRFYTVVESWP